MTTTNNNNKVLFITGASTGIGLAITKYFLEKGYKVAATSRSKDNLLKVVGNDDPNQFLALENDLLNDEAIKKTVEEVVSTFGRIDIVVNNAGFGYYGPAEGHTMQDYKNLFDINPGSHLFNVSSICSTWAIPLFASYSASKSALDGLTESYAAEVKELLGINVTILNIGTFQSSFQSSTREPSIDLKAKYASVYASFSSSESLKLLEWKDPVKIAEIIQQVSDRQGPAPLHLFIGPDSDHLARQKIKLLQKDLDDNVDLTVHKFLPSSA
ncbi:short-chain dehydrogenase/reductase SDR [Cavenderia fasciculata]|uniref:Short-chain dehydrogenase/reductase SDR n=1 Tax=Cavenderia fasciculata TaxID=261658 RepID=F4PJL3_CACFS|nr:short-chain dehydrogenase/reductase SDR [Cavenderia fasciculata]EGG23787.1 short-chain dehydrogenase/reductase SDR [Cavenderia fasciculata]|eukprot:XP_004361638.1 short-chain dehydrogenase/reductase SDR [Cavenderia fasciculata]